MTSHSSQEYRDIVRKIRATAIGTEDIGPVDTSTKQCTDYLMNYNAIAYFLGVQVENKPWTSYSLDGDDSTESAKIKCSVDSIQLLTTSWQNLITKSD